MVEYAFFVQKSISITQALCSGITDTGGKAWENSLHISKNILDLIFRPALSERDVELLQTPDFHHLNICYQILPSCLVVMSFLSLRARFLHHQMGLTPPVERASRECRSDKPLRPINQRMHFPPSQTERMDHIWAPRKRTREFLCPE